MKIGIQYSTNNGFALRWGEETYKKLKKAGFDCVDFDLTKTETIFYADNDKVWKEAALNEVSRAKQAEITIHQVHGPWQWPPKDYTEQDRAERMEKMKKSIEVTAFMGCKYWVVHPIMPCYVDDVGTPDEQKTWDINLEFMTELLAHAKKYDVTICLENMPFKNFSIAAPADILRFVKTINDENFKICLDTGHLPIFNKDLSIYEEVKSLEGELKVLHVHDNKLVGDEHLLPYFGLIDWQQFSKALNEIGFDGVVSLETMPSTNLNGELFDKVTEMYALIAKDIATNF